MKKFIFTLAGLRSIKVKQESQKKQELAVLEQNLAAEQAIMDDLQQKAAALRRGWQAGWQNGGLQQTDLRQFDLCLSQNRQEQQKQLGRIRQAERERNLCRDQLWQLMQDLKMLDNLREQQYETWKKEMTLEEEKIVDDLVSFRQAVNKHVEVV
ncbi:MAG: flagellar FliJ family protein [Clostridiaceae bacterium]|nr:flagellar FliJ family protein [Clostridiaceae bacterium]